MLTWMKDRIAEAQRTDQAWMLDPLAVERAWEGKDDA
jgi:hypothetical protein